MRKNGIITINTEVFRSIHVDFTCLIDIERSGHYVNETVDFDINYIKYELHNKFMELHFESLNDKNKQLINEALSDWFEENRYGR